MPEFRLFDEEFTKLLSSLQTDAEIDWRKCREEIFALHDLANEDHEFEAVLNAYLALMRLVERQGEAADKDKLTKLVSEGYNLLLVKENVRGKTDGTIDPVKMKKIADREIIAGRMDPSDEIYKLCLQFEGSSKVQTEKKGFFRRLFGN